MYCKNLTKKINGKLACKIKKQVITLKDCENCLNFILMKNKGINKVSKKRIFVSEETYNNVLKRDKERCRLCGTNKNLQLHHIIYRSENKGLIDKPNNCIMLCFNCHKLCHSNKHLWQPYLKKLINKQ